VRSLHAPDVTPVAQPSLSQVLGEWLRKVSSRTGAPSTLIACGNEPCRMVAAQSPSTSSQSMPKANIAQAHAMQAHFMQSGRAGSGVSRQPPGVSMGRSFPDVNPDQAILLASRGSKLSAWHRGGVTGRDLDDQGCESARSRSPPRRCCPRLSARSPPLWKAAIASVSGGTGGAETPPLCSFRDCRQRPRRWRLNNEELSFRPARFSLSQVPDQHEADDAPHDPDAQEFSDDDASKHKIYLHQVQYVRPVVSCATVWLAERTGELVSSTPLVEFEVCAGSLGTTQFWAGSRKEMKLWVTALEVLCSNLHPDRLEMPPSTPDTGAMAACKPTSHGRKVTSLLAATVEDMRGGGSSEPHACAEGEEQHAPRSVDDMFVATRRSTSRQKHCDAASKHTAPQLYSIARAEAQLDLSDVQVDDTLQQHPCDAPPSEDITSVLHAANHALRWTNGFVNSEANQGQGEELARPDMQKQDMTLKLSLLGGRLPPWSYSIAQSSSEGGSGCDPPHAMQTAITALVSLRGDTVKQAGKEVRGSLNEVAGDSSGANVSWETSLLTFQVEASAMDAVCLSVEVFAALQTEADVSAADENRLLLASGRWPLHSLRQGVSWETLRDARQTNPGALLMRVGAYMQHANVDVHASGVDVAKKQAQGLSGISRKPSSPDRVGASSPEMAARVPRSSVPRLRSSAKRKAGQRQLAALYQDEFLETGVDSDDVRVAASPHSELESAVIRPAACHFTDFTCADSLPDSDERVFTL